MPSMRIVFLSLPPEAGWGGSEELWADTALAALDDGHEVWICPRVDDSGNDARLRELLARGANLVSRQAEGHTGAEVVPQELLNLASAARAVFVSAGGSIGELIEPDVDRLLAASSGAVTAATVQLVSERDLPSAAERACASHLLQRISMLVLPARRSHEIL